MKRAIYPGSFDPITLGHLDVLQRAVGLFDEVIIAVALNESKHPFFTFEERSQMVRQSLQELGLADRVAIRTFSGLLIDFAREEKACALIRGLRAVSDFEFEFQMALMNRSLDPSLETLFLMPRDKYSYLSSRIVKEIARLHGDISPFVPACVREALEKKFTQ